MRRSRRRHVKIAGATLAGLALTMAVLAAVFREHLQVKRFAVVEPGGLYRGAYAEPWPLRRMIEKHGIRHILCLMSYPSDDSRRHKEQTVAAETGATLRELPMPGNGCAGFALLDRAADFIADPANRPLFIHCAAGVQRTGASIAAYRMRHQGWTYEQAIAEAEQNGLNRRKNPELYEHLRRYADHLESEKAERRNREPAGATQPAPSTNRTS